MIRSFIQRSTLVFVAIVLFSGCDELGRHQHPKADAVAVLRAAEGHQVQGTVSFARVNQGLRVIAHVQGLTAGDHGYHKPNQGSGRCQNLTKCINARW